MQKMLPYSELIKRPVTIRAVSKSDAIYGSKGQLEFDASDVRLVEPYAAHLVGTIGIKGFGETMIYRGDTIRVRGKLYPARGSRQASMSFAKITRLHLGTSKIYELRRNFAAGLQSAVPQVQGAFGLGILIGQRTTLPESINQDLSATGLTHIVAVSGYNLTILVMLAHRIAKKRSKYQALILTIGLIGLFIVITGNSASIIRAGLVSGLSLLAYYYGRTVRPILLILLAAVITAAWFPPYLWSDLGWHLSFLAFFGVLVVARSIQTRFFARKDPKLILQLFLETTSAQLMTLPLVMYIFGNISVVSLLANMLVVPLIPLAMAVTFIAGIAGMTIVPIASWLAWPTTVILTYILDVISLMARIPNALAGAKIAWWQMLLAYGYLCVMVGLWWQKKGRNAKITDMSGHSKWSTIKRQKGAKDAARGAIFTRLGNAIAVAAKNGADPDMNFSLRLAIDKAKAANMPSANIQRSIDRGSGKLGGAQIQEVLYEGYGPGGVAVIVECATDNTNRTYPEVKLAFSKHGGNIAEKGAVAFQFDHKGMIRVKGKGDDLMLQALDAGAEDVQEEGEETVIYTASKELAKVRDALKNAGIEIIEAELTYVPNNTVEVSDEATAGKIMRMMEALENLDDVSNTHVNFEISDGIHLG